MDLSAGNNQIQVNLVVNNGLLTLATTTNLTPIGNGTNNITISGLITDVNTALGSLSYIGNPNFNGPDALTMTT
ncbi:MAG: hypothetical protein HC796_05420 [Synechococcaceae cyanobacterium RL_1_2]|nr:hypothetical protein [Synechococcaceae cyanobacterium RL_1_2]